VKYNIVAVWAERSLPWQISMQRVISASSFAAAVQLRSLR
jgi:hypothetical protein